MFLSFVGFPIWSSTACTVCWNLFILHGAVFSCFFFLTCRPLALCYSTIAAIELAYFGSWGFEPKAFKAKVPCQRVQVHCKRHPNWGLRIALGEVRSVDLGIFWESRVTRRGLDNATGCQCDVWYVWCGKHRFLVQLYISYGSNISYPQVACKIQSSASAFGSDRAANKPHKTTDSSTATHHQRKGAGTGMKNHMASLASPHGHTTRQQWFSSAGFHLHPLAMTEESREAQPQPPQPPQPQLAQFGTEPGETPTPTPAGSPGAFGAGALALSLPEGDPPLPAPAYRSYSRRSSGDAASGLSPCARGSFSDVLEQIQVPCWNVLKFLQLIKSLL